jgi:hypothetical protein
VGPAGYGAENFVAAGSALGYRVNFENAETATAPAQRVLITDQLDPNLDWSSFRLTSINFGDHFIAVPPGTQNYQSSVSMTYGGETFDVDIDVEMNFQTGLRTVLCQSLNPDTLLPPGILSGFLPPEDGTGRGQGYISYLVYAKPNLSTGTAIRNVAQVTFDYNAPIATNLVDETDPSLGTDPAKEALVTIDAGNPTSSVAALPAYVPTEFTVSWSGTDDESGSGIGEFSIYVSDNSGAFVPFLLNTSETSATFTGQNSHTYAFYSVALDNVGHPQATPSAAQATTKVVAAITPQPIAISATEGVEVTAAVATFTDTDLGDTLSATIDWGDHVTTSGAVSGPDDVGVFTISGRHAYAEDGAYIVTVSVSDVGGATATVRSTANVADAPLSGVGVEIPPGIAVAGVVASFSDSDADEQPGDYSAAIDWGDGNSGGGDIIAGAAPGLFSVTGNHVYSSGDPHTISVTVTHGTAPPLVIHSQQPGQLLNVLGEFALAEDVYVIGAGVIAVAADSGLLKNDAAPGALTVAANSVSGVNGGTFAIHADGSFAYMPPADFPGFDSAQYMASDAQGRSATSNVYVLSQTAGVVWKFYESVLGRDPDPGGLQYWINDFVNGGETGDIAAGFFESDELLNEIITGYYQQYLLRAPDDSGLAHWGQVWHATGGPEIIKAGFADSPEFYASAGGAPEAWITQLYLRILNREPDPQGKQYWLNYLASHGNTAEARKHIALGFFTSLEAYKGDVTGWFQVYLQRAPSTDELNHYASEMRAGKTDRDIEQEITNLPEYGHNPPASPTGEGVRLPDYLPQTASGGAQQQTVLVARDSLFSDWGA